METNVTNEYRPFDDNRFYPGMIDEERQRRLTDFDFELDELTADDLVWMLSKSVAATAYSALTFVRDKVSVEAAQALSRQFGYEAGVSLFNRFRAKLCIAPGEALTPEQFARFQD